ncbi:Collagenase [Papilio machaon]|uniref:Collagenase n=1 Tax=Papilio machaon TaxID=76193 RepID=A0A0N0PEQ8_PAPMA|nr:Collagenase [Papilio machaon]
MRAATLSAVWAVWAMWAMWATCGALGALGAGHEALRVELHSGAPPPDALSGPGGGSARYHERVGEPLAEALRRTEAEAGEEAGGRSSRITGGLASYLGEHPFFAGLVITLNTGRTSVCGAALVSNYRLVTAAQCWWDGRAQAYSVLAVLGSVRLFSGGTRVSASAVIAHAGYDPDTLRNDIAVLVVPYISTTGYIRPIALPENSELGLTFTGLRATAIGYGKTGEWAEITSSAGLRDAVVPVLSNAECEAVYGAGAAGGGVLCTSGAGARGPCGGDGGGPLVLQFAGRRILIGVTSFVWAAGCDRGQPAGYTRVTTYAGWVRAQL